MSTTIVSPRRLTLATHASSACFFLSGMTYSSWAPLVPAVQHRIGLDNAGLGSVLLCLGAGSLITMPLAGILSSRFGCRAVIVPGILAAGLSLPVATLTTSGWQAAMVLMIFGGGLGIIDCVMNIHTLSIERRVSRSIISGVHAFFSFGAIAGSAGVTTLLSVGLNPSWTACVITAADLLIMLFITGWLLNERTAREPFLVRPHGVVILLGAICAIAFLMEGSILDWSGVCLTTLLHSPSAQAGLGYTAFATATTLFRMTGNRIIALTGRRLLLAGGTLIAAIGAAMIALMHSPAMIVAGCFLVGAGNANLVPQLFALVGAQKAMPQHPAVSAVTTLGYAGVLAGPALIGFIAHATGLSTAFAMLSGLLVLTALMILPLTRPDASGAG
ncbi:MFS transporter [Acetobacter sp. AN02]|uniref:MFS transporter n=1 Tax=Acetobacter sp. AN02 TaxID=2894186 RepID=UPI0024345AD2|nr:MFS transporter [Acetobacter sp. AN02]MDG6095217.1 MFS transporter [Acetobacter sp. AN02]